MKIGEIVLCDKNPDGSNGFCLYHLDISLEA
jgi:hypothetical protein